MAIAAVPFVLSWFLEEVPLRTSLARRPSEPPAGEAVAAGAPEELSGA